MNNSKEESDIWDGLARLAKAIAPFGVPFSAVFMANVVVIFMILFLQSQFSYLWLACLSFASVEVVMGVLVYKWKEEKILKK